MTNAESDITFTLRAIDEASQALDDVKQSLNDLGASGGEAAGGVEKAGDETDDLSKAMGGLGQAVSSISPQLSGLVGVTGNLATTFGGVVQGLSSSTGLIGTLTLVTGAVGAVAGAIGILGSAGFSFLEELTQMSAMTGLNIEQTERWSTALTIGGSDASRLSLVTMRLSSALEESAAGGSSRATQALTRLGVATKDVEGNVRQMGDILPEVFGGMAEVESETERAALATALFGRAGRQMLPFLADYQKYLADTDTLIKDYATNNADAKEKVDAHRIAVEQLKRQWEAITVEAEPPLTFAMKIVAAAFGVATFKVQEFTSQLRDAKDLMTIVSGLGTLDQLRNVRAGRADRGGGTAGPGDEGLGMEGLPTRVPSQSYADWAAGRGDRQLDEFGNPINTEIRAAGFYDLPKDVKPAPPTPYEVAMEGINAAIQRDILNAYREGGDRQAEAVRATQETLRDQAIEMSQFLTDKYGGELSANLSGWWAITSAESRAAMETIASMQREYRNAEIQEFLLHGEAAGAALREKNSIEMAAIQDLALETSKVFKVDLPTAFAASVTATKALTDALKQQLAAQEALRFAALSAVGVGSGPSGGQAAAIAAAQANPGQSFSSANMGGEYWGVASISPDGTQNFGMISRGGAAPVVTVKLSSDLAPGDGSAGE